MSAAWAARALRPDGTLVIVHACRPLHAPPSPLSSTHDRRELGRAPLDELLMRDPDSLQVRIEVEVCDEDPVTALITAARHHHAQGIVLGHEPHSRRHRAVGTVTSELLNVSPAPVITVPVNGVGDPELALADVGGTR